MSDKAGIERESAAQNKDVVNPFMNTDISNPPPARTGQEVDRILSSSIGVSDEVENVVRVRSSVLQDGKRGDDFLKGVSGAISPRIFSSYDM